jgi:hypothetical protein
MAMSKRSGFVDFLFAVTVGATFSNLGNVDLDNKITEFFVICGLIIVILEDYHLYHVHVVPTERENSSCDFIILLVESAILLAWYLSCTFVEKSHHTYALYSFAVFSVLKFVAGNIHWGSHPDPIDWRLYRYIAFLILPVVISFQASAHSDVNLKSQNKEKITHVSHKGYKHKNKEDTKKEQQQGISDEYRNMYIYAFAAWFVQVTIWRLVTKVGMERVSARERPYL